MIGLGLLARLAEAWDRCINDSGSENEKTFTNQLVGPYNGLQVRAESCWG